jgi:hypothetical protein
MKPRLKRVLNSTRKHKIFIPSHGERADYNFQSQKKNDVYSDAVPRIGLNIGKIAYYCPNCKRVNFIKHDYYTTRYGLYHNRQCQDNLMEIRVLKDEEKLIKSNFQKLPDNLRNKILSREV